MKILVGSTGFVGSNLQQAVDFDQSLHATNIADAYGSCPELLVYAGVRAAKFLANRDEQADWQQVSTAVENIEKIRPRRLVLISTIDVYPEPAGVDEDTIIDGGALAPYGRNRRRLECWVQEQMSDALILRLPALYGKNLRKNFLFDLQTLIPSMLAAEKYMELAEQSVLVRQSYTRQANGFYACKVEEKDHRNRLKQEFQQLGFTSLAFTDSRSSFQFYGLQFLWPHIKKALQVGIPLLNLATAPVQAGELHRFLCGRPFVNERPEGPLHYDVRTKYADMFSGTGGYIFSRQQVLENIRLFMEAQQ